MKKMDLIVLIGTLGGGGAERVAITIAERIAKTHSILLTILIKLKQEKYGSTIEISHLIKKPSSPLMLYLGFPIIVIKYMSLLLVKKPRCVLSILFLENILNMFISPIFKVKSIVSVHDIRSQTLQSKLHFRLLIPVEMFLLRHTRATAIAVSNGVKDDLVTNFGIPAEKIRVIYNPININQIYDLSAESIPEGIIQNDIPTIITVGRLSAVKAQWHLIRAFAAICKKRPARLLICGIGEEEAYLKSLVNDLGIRESVIFLGWQDNPYKYMARSTVFVLSSISEALPNVLTEAMATGCPVISADCSPGVREIIGENSEYGLLVKPMTGIRYHVDEELDVGEVSIYIAIQQILNNKELYKHYCDVGLDRARFFSEELRMNEYVSYVLG